VCGVTLGDEAALFERCVLFPCHVDLRLRGIAAAHIPLFLYPFLNTTSKTRPFEYLRLTSLGVIGALVKVSNFVVAARDSSLHGLQQNDNNTVIHFLLSTEIIPLCLRIMETGSELSKTVAIFIVQKILLDETGLTYICHTYERFYAVGTVLSNMVNQLVETQAVRLLKHVVRCYLRLSDNLRWVWSGTGRVLLADMYAERGRRCGRACLSR
jgi:CCR4-NOT transcription complex subunit 9